MHFLPITLFTLLTALPLSFSSPLPAALQRLTKRDGDPPGTAYLFIEGDKPPQIAFRSITPPETLDLGNTLTLLSDFGADMRGLASGAGSGGPSTLTGEQERSNNGLKISLQPADGQGVMPDPRGYKAEAMPLELVASLPTALSDFFEARQRAFGMAWRVVDDSKKVVYAVGTLTGRP